jgi:hypothetical protein
MANAALSLGRQPSSLVLLSTTGLSEGGACHLATISSRRRRKGLSRPRLARPWPLGLTRVLFLRRIGPVPFTGVCVPGPLLLLLRQSHVCHVLQSFIYIPELWLEAKHDRIISLDRRVLSRTPVPTKAGLSSWIVVRLARSHTGPQTCSYRLFRVSQCLKVSVERGGEPTLASFTRSREFSPHLLR